MCAICGWATVWRDGEHVRSTAGSCDCCPTGIQWECHVLHFGTGVAAMQDVHVVNWSWWWTTRMRVDAVQIEIVPSFIRSQQQQSRRIECHCSDDIGVRDEMGNNWIVSRYSDRRSRWTSVFDLLLLNKNDFRKATNRLRALNVPWYPRL